MHRLVTRIAPRLLPASRTTSCPRTQWIATQTRNRYYSNSASSSQLGPKQQQQHPRLLMYKGASIGTVLISAATLMHCYSEQGSSKICYAEADQHGYHQHHPSSTATVIPSSPHLSTASRTVAELLDDDGLVAMQAKTTSELGLAIVVYGLCMAPGLVDLAPYVIKLSEKLHLQAPVYWIMKRTVFRQFCGGETPEECVASMQRLAQSGINCILDLSIEADMDSSADKRNGSGSMLDIQEQRADMVAGMIQECLQTASKSREFCTTGAFAAIKVTAFAPPELLLRLNQILTRLDQAFDAWQLGNDTIDIQGLKQIIQHVLPPPKSAQQQSERERVLESIQGTTLDRIQVAKLFDLQGAQRNIWWGTSAAAANNQQLQQQDSLFLTPQELAAYDRMVDRLEKICEFAHEHHVGVMVDAEQSYFQEAIDHVALNLQEKFNRCEDKEHSPTVYNTYQMYTKTAQCKLERDVERARRENFGFAAKLVRGAYIVIERKRASQLGYASPIQESLQDTHDSFDNGVCFLLDKVKERNAASDEPLTSTTTPICFMVASHNRDSIVLTVKEMERHGVSPSAGVVHFGQLFGMQDQISYTLGKNGYSIYKYLPYGKIDEVMPYLLRRAQENSGILGNVSKECRLMWKEIKNRMLNVLYAAQPTAAVTSTVHVTNDYQEKEEQQQEYPAAAVDIDVNSEGAVQES